MLIRACTVADLAAVQAIYAHHVLTGLGTFEEVPPPLTDMRQRLDAIVNGGYPFLVGEMDGRITGYAYATAFRPRAAYRHTAESSVYIAPDMQRRGVGRALMLQVIADCQKLRHRQLLAVIGDSGNAGSIGLHSSLGFERVGLFKEVGYKFKRWVDVVLMQRAL